MHSNFRELLTVLKMLLSWKHYIKGKNLQILLDNITTVTYINHLGGRSRQVSDLMTTIWATANQLDVHLSAKFLAGWQNTRADELSRQVSLYDWKLNPKTFCTIDKMWGPYTMDRFVTETNTCLENYNSLYWDPGTKGIDTLAQTDWGGPQQLCQSPLLDVEQNTASDKMTKSACHSDSSVVAGSDLVLTTAGAQRVAALEDPQ